MPPRFQLFASFAILLNFPPARVWRYLRVTPQA